MALLLCIAAICYFIFGNRSSDSSEELQLETNEVVEAAENIPESIAAYHIGSGFVDISDTIVNNVALSIFKPIDMTPTLHIGSEVLNDSTAKFVVQAADIRRDNGGIVGAYVDKGELISKGQAKSGFCAIIGGKINIGVAEATPLLEQALETDGYFFRQYPLVVANQIVENKPKGKSLRKALAEIDGEPIVVMSREKLTFHDFSQSLVDLGVNNAIYLVGSTTYGFVVDSNGKKIEFGRQVNQMPQNTNYIVWR
ncbi:MAG: phosphodiester glycosidase family protein [Bacteroides sp.]|nr:phosphodiester glycosidase family protein [Bacteroides sp.]MCM1412811.1 phosphodiester glycosidase family protein [Bacteroides sp.]MCM1471480.1 phosphodiester glycosidase family protein [Bacteroides sp.]